jgi:hypothetical protein
MLAQRGATRRDAKPRNACEAVELNATQLLRPFRRDRHQESLSQTHGTLARKEEFFVFRTPVGVHLYAQEPGLEVRSAHNWIEVIICPRLEH